MTLGEMRATVFAQKPVFKHVLRQHGTESLSAYFRDLGAYYRPKNVPRSRQKELTDVLCDETGKILGKRAKVAMARYFKKRYFVSTAAHHDFATHPFFANYLLAAGYANTDAGIPIVPVLSCAGISLNNSSFPRGLLFHDEKLNEQRVRLVSLKHHQHPVYDYPGYDADTLRKIKPADLVAAALSGKALEQEKLSSQITLAVNALFKNVPGLSKTEMVYLPQEEIAVRLFLKYHLNRKTIIHRIVFDKKIRELFLERFDGIIGAQLFWGVNEHERVSLRVKNNHLVSTDGKVNVPLTPSALKKALLAKQLMPTMSFTLALLSFYYGLACAGGFSQVNYLSEMKTAYLDVLASIPRSEKEAAIAKAVPTDLFAGEVVLVTLGAGKTKVAATGLDVVLRQETLTESHLRNLLDKTSLRTATDRMMPELYKIISHEKT